MDDAEEATLPLAAVERIMRNAGAQKVSSEAVKLLQESTHGLGQDLAADAVRIAQADSGSRITADHIQDAVSGE